MFFFYIDESLKFILSKKDYKMFRKKIKKIAAVNDKKLEVGINEMIFSEEIMDDNLRNECSRNTVIEVRKGEYVEEIQESLLS